MAKRRRVKQDESLETRLAKKAQSLRDQAASMTEGPDREALLNKANEHEAAAKVHSHLTGVR